MTADSGVIDVLLVDDHTALREGLGVMLERRACRIVASVASVREAIAAFEQHRPDVAVIDIRLSEGSGIKLAEAVRRAHPETGVVLYTGSENPSILADAIASGAGGIVLKPGSLDELLEAIRAVHRGERYLDPRLVALMAGSERAEEPVLTKREREVLRLLGTGLSGTEAAERLSISTETLRTHVRNAMEKLGARTRIEAVVSAWRKHEISL